jgi:glucan phosphoethanolaminetransferase (alkaline phosphatase superfamily)
MNRPPVSEVVQIDGGLKSERHLVDWANFQALLLIWAPVAVAGLYAKWAILVKDGYVKTALALGQRLTPNASDLFTVPEKLSFFRADLLVSMLLVPAILLLISRWRSRLNIWLVALVCIVWIAILTVQLEAFRLIGSFQSLDLLKDGLRWGLENSRQARAYILGIAIFRLSFLILAVLAASLFASRNAVPLIWRRLQKAGVAAWIVLLGLTGLSWLPWMPPTASHASVFLAAITTLPEQSSVSRLASLSEQQLQLRYRQLTHTRERLATPAQWGAARGYDVVFFVLETTPEACVSFQGSMDALPNMANLRQHAWVASQHYTTYPVTARALFSILTSMYPSDSSKDTVRLRDRVNGGMVQALNSAGYETAVYGSSSSIAPWAKDVFGNLGFRRIHAADDGPGSSSWARLGIQGPVDPDADQQAYVVNQQRLDLRALDDMKTDLAGWIQNNQRFAAIYLPQISHGPWGDIRSGGQERSPLARCQALGELQDKWLGDLVNLLREHGRLSRTLIVVTGDHGVRNSVEDPAFAAGVVDDYTYRVPFLLYAPGVLDRATALPWVTSHIDIQPSILDLLGISRDTDREQGSPLWEEALPERTTFFLGNLFFGVDGYHSKGKFYSWNRPLDVTYENDKMRFDSRNAVPSRTRRHDEITEPIRSLDEMRAAWLLAMRQ